MATASIRRRLRPPCARRPRSGIVVLLAAGVPQVTPAATLETEIVDHVLLLTLNRPQHLNAFTVPMAEELVQAFARASVDDAVRAVVVTGAGRAFCAGMDLKTDGNVFGLDETQQPTLDDLTAASAIRPYTTGCVIPAAASASPSMTAGSR